MFRKVCKKLLLGFKNFLLGCFAFYFVTQFLVLGGSDTDLDTDIIELWAEPFNLHHVYMPYSWEFTAILSSFVFITLLVHYKLFCNRTNRKIICTCYKSKIVLPLVILLVLYNPFFSMQHLLAIITKKAYHFSFGLGDILSFIFVGILFLINIMLLIILSNFEDLYNEVERKESGRMCNKEIENCISEDNDIFEDFDKEV